MFHFPWYHGRLFSRTNLLLVVGLCACTTKHLDPWPGSSATVARESNGRISPKAQLPAWREYSALERLSLVNRDAVATNNHNPFEWNVRIRITTPALPLYERWHVGDVMPVGTWIIAEHESRAGGAAGPYYFANKTDAGWSFGAATRDGLLLPTDPSCAQCHAEAPADYVFGLSAPRSHKVQIDQRPDGG